MRKALLVIDIQNDYFENGKFPLWNTEEVLANIENAIDKANADNIPVILVQHISKSSSSFFCKGTEGVQIHPRILNVAPSAKIVNKSHADSFYKTELEEVLTRLEVEELLVCGMMTQNCVTHTAISKAAEKYTVKVLSDCCTTVNEPIHLFALDAMSIRVPLISYIEAL